MPSEREEALSNIAEARRELLAAIEALSDEQLSKEGCVGEWAAKDVLSHIASWDEVCAQDFRRLARGDGPALVAFKLDRVDEYNATIMSLRRHFPAAQARRELEAGRAELLEVAQGLPDAQFAQGRFVRGLLDIAAHHDRDHAQMVHDWRQQQGL